MMQFATDPIQWRVELRSGASLGIWAVGYGEVDGYYRFNVLVDASEEEQAEQDLVIEGRTPSNPERLLLTVVRIPVSEVKEIQSEAWGSVPVS